MKKTLLMFGLTAVMLCTSCDFERQEAEKDFEKSLRQNIFPQMGILLRKKEYRAPKKSLSRKISDENLEIKKAIKNESFHQLNKWHQDSLLMTKDLTDYATAATYLEYGPLTSSFYKDPSYIGEICENAIRIAGDYTPGSIVSVWTKDDIPTVKFVNPKELALN